MFQLFCLKEAPNFLFFSNDVPNILYYSHIPTAIIALLFGIFVFLSNKKLLAGRILFFIAASFAVWSAIDLILWAENKSYLIMFFWSLIIMIEILIFAASVYLSYIFMGKKDVSFLTKIILTSFILPVVVAMTSKFYLTGFDLVECVAKEGFFALQYTYLVEFLFIFWIIVIFVKRFKGAEVILKKQLTYFIGGLILFLFAFSGANLISSITGTDIGWDSANYGLFGMPIFIGFLAYLIVKHKTFNIKLLGAEALVAGLVILIGSQFFFIQNFTNKILTGITLFLAVVFGYILVRSVRKEVAEREQLAVLSHELEHANQELKELDKAKSEFISIVSHQLRTPLSITKGYVSMILEGVYGIISDKIKDPLQKVYVSNEGLIALVNNLLDLSRMEAGTIKYDFVDADFVKMIEEIVMELELEAKHRNLYLKWARPTEQLPMIKADVVKFKQVIEILIENSLKYTPQGGVNVSLAKENNSLVFKVEDTGIGIDPHETEHLFNKFGRGVAGSKVNATGVGLGLYAAKQIVLKHNGDIWAESDGVGKGSRFYVKLPVA